MKYGYIAEKWLKDRDDKELIVLYQCTKNEQIREKLPYSAFTWTTKRCKELTDLNSLTRIDHVDSEIKIESRATTNAQLDCIFRYRKSGICIKCGKSTLDIIKIMNKKNGKDIYLVDYVFLSIHTNTSLCIDCIGEFLLDIIKESVAKVDDNTINMFRQRVTQKVYTNLWDAFFH